MSGHPDQASIIASIAASLSPNNLVKIDTNTRSKLHDSNEVFMKTRVVGQEEAVRAALAAIARARNPLRDPDRPIAVIYELGYSRTGKTLIAETIAEILHGDKSCLVKINGGAYKDRHEVARLVGAPPGYLGYVDADKARESTSSTDTSAKLTRKNLIASRGKSQTPVTVVLIDEANLMHEASDDAFMSIMDKGELDLGNNLVTDFRDCIIIFTSNIGMDEVIKSSRQPTGFTGHISALRSAEDMRNTVTRALEKRYRPEWLNRVDNIVIFNQHTINQLNQIVDVEIEKFSARIAKTLRPERQFKLELDSSAKSFLLTSTLADKGNLANLKRAIQIYLIDKLGNLLSLGLLASEDTVYIKHEDSSAELTFYLSQEALNRAPFETDAGVIENPLAADTNNSTQTVNYGRYWDIWKRGDASNYMRLVQDDMDNNNRKHYHIVRTYNCRCSKCNGITENMKWEWSVPYEKGVDPITRIPPQSVKYVCRHCRETVSVLPPLDKSEWQTTD